jgi:hypothetical protein|tara:strand:+ start:660 stop:953 length:294 start_codon:yes stop_codon:yes gene_type:complete
MRKEANVKAYVWKQARGGDTYSLQVESDKTGVRLINRINKLADGSHWVPSGSSVGGKKLTLLYTRKFDSESDLKKWAKEFPYEVFYEGTNGKQRRIG